MRQFITLAIVGSLLLALLALVSTTKPRDDDLSRSIAQMVKR